MTLQSINPATEEVLATFEEFSLRQVEEAVGKAHEVRRSWSQASFAERGRVLREAARYMREQKDRLARLMTLEMGKPITESEAEVDKCAWVCEFYAENAERFLSDEPIRTNAKNSYVAFEPLGV